MAWFDYLGGIAQGVGQASQTGLKHVAQRQEEEKARVAEELARLGADTDLSPEQVKRYSPYVGAGSFLKTPEGTIRLRQTPQQEVVGYQLEEARGKWMAEKEWERLTTPDVTGKIPAHSQPFEKMATLARKAGVNYMESGAASPEHVKQGLTQFGSVVAKLIQLEQQQKAKLDELERRAASAEKIAEIRGEYAKTVEGLRAALATQQKLFDMQTRSDESLNTLAGQLYLRARQDAATYGTPVLSLEDYRKQAQALRGKAPTPAGPSGGKADPFGLY